MFSSSRINKRDAQATLAARAFREVRVPEYPPEPPATWKVLLGLGVALVFQASLAPFFAVRGATVSWVLLVVLWFSLRAGTTKGLVVGLFAGACEDALAGGTGAAWTFATGIVGTLAGRFARTPFADLKLTLVPAVALATLLRDGLFALMLRAEGQPLALPVHRFHLALWQSVLDAAAAWALLVLFPRLGVLGAHRR